MAPRISTEKEFRRRQKVVAVVDLPGVPAGTYGKIWFVSGVTWVRYHVAFENGEELANVDGGSLRDRKEWLAEQAEVDREKQAAEREAQRAQRRAELLENLAETPASH
jgi:hypothetical protein